MITNQSVTDHRLPTRLAAGPTSWTRRTDVVIVGTGAAGLAAAVHLAQAGVRCVLITKGTLGDGSSAWAQGGLAAVMADTGGTDSLDLHVADTLTAGAGLCDPEAVRTLVSAAPEAIRRLIRIGAQFDRTPGGALDLGLEGGHHARRIVHAGGDASGAEVCRVLARAAWACAQDPTLTVAEHCYAMDAVTSRAGTVAGVRVLDARGRVGVWEARAVVLATGGIGQVWSTTTNPTTSTGDGLALALRAGAEIRDVEFMQFHPTILVVPPGHRRDDDRGVLVSEAVRGEGAVLVDGEGVPIMAGLHPLADLAPRDVVSAAMQEQMLRHDLDHLYLDARHLGEEGWRHHFPSILLVCRERGVDPVTEPIPVRPAAHYHCGGVVADLDGQTTLPGLYAVGEVACTGVQGANRLASNSITEALVAGDRVGALLARQLPVRHTPTLEHGRGSCVPADQRSALTTATTRFAGVLRDDGGLAQLTEALAGLPQVDSPATPADVETTNLHTAATLVAMAARLRTESRGCHRRSDHPAPQAGCGRHLTMVMAAGGELQLVQQAEQAA